MGAFAPHGFYHSSIGGVRSRRAALMAAPRGTTRNPNLRQRCEDRINWQI